LAGCGARIAHRGGKPLLKGYTMKAFALAFLFMTIAAPTVTLAPASAEAKVGSATFTGIVNHVSSNNLKVTDAKQNQTLSFLIVPKFDQIFSDDGKTTYQMKAIKAGQYVKVYYDQKMLGQRHADRIILLHQNNSVKGTQ
jgi:hypothetical protein